MNTRKQLRRGSGEGEGEWMKAMFEEYAHKTSQTIIKSINQSLEQKFTDLERKMEQRLEKMEKKWEGEIQKTNDRVDWIEKDRENELDRLALLELRNKEFCLRFRGIPEFKEEELKGKIIQALATMIDWEEDRLNDEIEKIFRVNSKYAELHNKPRDVLVEFSRRKVRDLVLQTSYDIKFDINGVEIMVLKEIPVRILKKRKEYGFLTDILKRNNVSYRWERLEGLCVTFQQKRFKLTTISKAKNFLERYRKELEQEVDKLKRKKGVAVREEKTSTGKDTE